MTTHPSTIETNAPVTIRGLIFDFDGTLAATLPLCYAATRDVVRHYTGRDMADHEIHAHFGPSEEGILPRLIPGVPLDELLTRFMDAYSTNHHLCPDPFPGIVEMLERLRDQGIRLALVTGKGPRSARHSLKHYALDHFFEHVETRDPERMVKTERIRHICRQWGLPPETIAYVGDDPSDVDQARAAGVVPISAAWDDLAPVQLQSERRPAFQFFSLGDFMQWIAARAEGTA